MDDRRFWIFILSMMVSAMLPLRHAMAEPMLAIPNNHPLVTRPSSSAPPDMKLDITMAFKIRNQDQWERIQRAHRDPRTAESHHQWTPEEIHQRFGALPATFHMVEQWLLSKGFTVILERYGKGTVNSILVAGSAAQAESAFGVK